MGIIYARKSNKRGEGGEGKGGVTTGTTLARKRGGPNSLHTFNTLLLVQDWGGEKKKKGKKKKGKEKNLPLKKPLFCLSFFFQQEGEKKKGEGKKREEGDKGNRLPGSLASWPISGRFDLLEFE